MFGQESSILLNSLLYKNNIFDYFVYFFAQIFPFLLMIVVFVFFLIIKKDIKAFLTVCLVTASSWSLTEILKFIFSHPRPFLSIPEFSPLFVFGGNDSFPSGHATVFAAVAMAVYFENRKLGIFFIFSALIISISRVISGVHYLADILAGLLLGFVIVYLSYKYIGKLRNK
ncbi:MAG: phosphatase PAP2 family protein [Candidatus Paceibacterota bacterium]